MLYTLALHVSLFYNFCMSRLRKAALSAILIIAMSTGCLFSESVFSNYDFTFYNTVSQSLAIMDSSTFGLDYTGFGFIGNSRTNGLFVRIGLQAPLTTIGNIWQIGKEEQKPADIIQLKEPDRSYLAPVAAHERTDIEVTEEMRKHDDDIMNDDSEWE